MTRTPSARATRLSGARRSRRTPLRRGTVLLFALGVLAVISIAALSYVTLVRVDRQASSAVAKTTGYHRQEGIVVDTMGAVIAADLFGNKLVTTDVPAGLNPNDPTVDPIWPRMFEDGEFRDYPWTNFATFDRNLPGKTPKNAVTNWTLDPTQVAPPDDAWLAPIDPTWFLPGSNNDQTHWRQITNLRSVYTYDNAGTPSNFTDDRWIRGDGKFVDLGQLFLDSRTVGSEDRGNPGTNLLDRTILGVNSPDGPVMPRAAAGNVTDAPFAPMNFADKEGGEPTFTGRDERFWADTDGDLRADARWQLIDALGNREGLMWVVAARIIDLSAVVNVNSSIEGGYGSSSVEDYAEGRTPADIDLYRLLRNDSTELDILTPGRVFQWTGPLVPHGRPLATRLTNPGTPNLGTFSDHLVNRLRVVDLTNEPGIAIPPEAGTGVTLGDFQLPVGWVWQDDGINKRLKWHQRLALWDHFGSAPGRGPTIETARGPVRPGYSNVDMMDLYAFAGTNHRSMLTDLEETLDGPDSATSPGFLPRPEDQPSTATGPLRANTRPGDTRAFGQNQINGSDAKPATAQLRGDPRRLLTTISGVSDVSPVPVLNHKAPSNVEGEPGPYASKFYNTKIRLADFSLADVPDAFQAFVWALAPLATDEYLTAYTHQRFGALVGDNINGTTIGTAPSFHYGGVDGGASQTPAENITRTGGARSVEFGSNSGASYAVLTSAALAVNLKDASDADSDPTAARFLVASPAADDYALRSMVVDGTAVLGTRFSQGNIPEMLLPTLSVGNRVSDGVGLEIAVDTNDQTGKDAWKNNNATAGVTMVGAERTAYIGEVFVAGAFESTNDPVIDLTTEGAGAMLAVQMINPWPSSVSLDGFELVIVNPGMGPSNLDSTDHMRFSFPNGSTVPPGFGTANGQATFLFTHYDTSKSAYKDLLGRNDTDTDLAPPTDSLEDILLTTLGALPPNQLIPDADTRAKIDAEHAFIMRMRNTGMQRMTVVLRRPVTGLAEPAVVDVLETNKPFFDYGTSLDLRDPGFGFTRNYFQAIGYAFANVPATFDYDAVTNQQFVGRVVLTASVSRPVRTAGATSGEWFSYAAIQPLATETHVIDMDPDPTPSPGRYYAHAWLTDAPITPNSTVVLFPSELTDPMTGGRRDPKVTLVEDMFLKEKDAKQKTSDAGAEASYSDRLARAGGWQIFVPDRPLTYVSELGQLSTFAHTCLNNELNDLEAWATIGQQLRSSIEWTFPTAPSSTCDNPYLGVLDMTRYLPTGSGGSMETSNVRDESLMVPLATRVFDCFEALRPSGTLAQGRININTAPERVLQVLPLMAPGNTMLSELPQTNDRVKLMLQYRDAWDPDFGTDYFAYNAGTLLQLGQNIFGAPGESNFVRRHDRSHDPNLTGPNVEYPYTTGFATAGELAFLDIWGDRGEVSASVGASPQGFAYPLGANAANDGSNAIGRRLFEGEGSTSADFDGIADDPEERLALYRAVSNIVSSRSDVFGAWFILRGYDPKVIESIPVTNGQELDALNNELFTPAYESRWFVIFDRSNVRKPTDRPKVVLKVQLPSSRP